MSRLFSTKANKDLAQCVERIRPKGGSRILTDKKAGVELLNPWRIAFELKELAGVNSAGVNTKNGPERAEFWNSETWRPLVDQARTFFKDNPDFDL